MDINMLLEIEEIEIQRNEGEITGIIKVDFKDVSDQHAFEIMKMFFGEESHLIKLLKVENVTYVKPGIDCSYSCKYVYNFGKSLLQVIFLKMLDCETIFEVKMVE